MAASMAADMYGRSFHGLESCSVCLEPVEDAGERSVAKLKCGHHFHLDCIGSAFNAKGAMQCPNCRSIERGQWLYANGTRVIEDFWDDGSSEAGDFEYFYHEHMLPTGHPYTRSSLQAAAEFTIEHGSAQPGGGPYHHMEFHLGDPAEVSARYPGVVVNLSYNYDGGPSHAPPVCPYLHPGQRRPAESRLRITSAGAPATSSSTAVHSPLVSMLDHFAEVEMRDAEMYGNTNIPPSWRPQNLPPNFGTDTRQDAIRRAEIQSMSGGHPSAYGSSPFNYNVRADAERAANVAANLGTDSQQQPAVGNGTHFVDWMLNSPGGLCPRPGPGQGQMAQPSTAQQAAWAAHRSLHMGSGSSSNSGGSRPSRDTLAQQRLPAQPLTSASSSGPRFGDQSRSRMVAGDVAMGSQEPAGVEAHGPGGGANPANDGQGFTPWRRVDSSPLPFWASNPTPPPRVWEPMPPNWAPRVAPDLQLRQPAPPGDADFGGQSVYAQISRSFGFEGFAEPMSHAVPIRPPR